MPVRAMTKPLAAPASAPMARPINSGRDGRQAVELHHRGEADRDEPADGAERKVHLADGDDDELAQRDHHVDGDGREQHEDVEGRQEARLEERDADDGREA